MAEENAIAILQQHRAELSAMGVKSLMPFGSFIRGQERPDSDIDILVVFTRPVGLLAFIRLKQRLAELLGRPVDLVTPEALKPPLRDGILREAQNAGQGLEI
ncbi:MAG TPA: nucleotidyltransferase family protein [Desulfobaccales bacterium]